MAKKADRNKNGQFVIGNPGREKTFISPEEMDSAIQDYFGFQDNRPIIKIEFHGKDAERCEIPLQRPYTIEGLARTLGLTRMSLINYEKREGYEPYFDIIKRAKEKIREQWIELGLMNQANAYFTKFILVNNAEYSDKSEVDHTTGGKSMNTLNVSVQNESTKRKLDKL